MSQVSVPSLAWGKVSIYLESNLDHVCGVGHCDADASGCEACCYFLVKGRVSFEVLATIEISDWFVETDSQGGIDDLPLEPGADSLPKSKHPVLLVYGESAAENASVLVGAVGEWLLDLHSDFLRRMDKGWMITAVSKGIVMACNYYKDYKLYLGNASGESSGDELHSCRKLIDIIVLFGLMRHLRK